MRNMIQVALSWKLAIFKAVNGWFTVMSMSVIAGITALDGVNPATAKLVIFILTALVAGNKFIDGFLDQTIANIKRSSDPLGLTIDTSQITKQQVQQTTVTTETKQ